MMTQMGPSQVVHSASGQDLPRRVIAAPHQWAAAHLGESHGPGDGTQLLKLPGGPVAIHWQMG